MRLSRGLATIGVTIGLLMSGGMASSPAVAKSCGAGYKHGVISGAHKCLRRGQYCAKGSDRTYHRYGYHCHTGRLR